ncbi:hypothetical protein GCM10020220_005510 [Nonomuraea rubra]
MRLDRDYRIVTSQAMRCGIYVQGASEHTHGTDLDPAVQHRDPVGEIVESVADRLRSGSLSSYALSR